MPINNPKPDIAKMYAHAKIEENMSVNTPVTEWKVLMDRQTKLCKKNGEPDTWIASRKTQNLLVM